MRRLRHFLEQARGHKSRKLIRSSGTSLAGRVWGSFEPLEQRQLLAANILGSVDADLLAVCETNELDLDVAGGTAILGFRMYGTGGTLDPDCVGIKNLADHTIAPFLSDADIGAGTDSVVLAELGPGSYTVTTRAEGTTTGTYRIDAFLPGDLNGDGLVDSQELLWTQAAVVQAMGGWNHITQLYYAQYGINLSTNLYRQELDCDGDCRIGGLDLDVVTTNASAGKVTIEFQNDVKAPVVEAHLVNDTGRSATDGITNDATIAGTITDRSEVVEFLASVDRTDRGDYCSITGEIGAGGNFQLGLAKLEAIAGGSLANNGPHTLYLIARDEYDNESAPRAVVFELDTIAPAAPTGLDLVAASDLGLSNTDNVTSDNTPTLTASAETGTMVAFYSDLNVPSKLGEALASSPATITATAMVNGMHSLTAKATDVAGNTSGASAAMAVTIDTIAPAAPSLDLTPADDTGTVGDHVTSKTSVTLEGVAEAGSRITLNGTSTTDANATTGVFSFAAVPLVFGVNSFTAVSTDVAGNTSSFARTIRQNNPPALGTPVATIDLDEDPPPQTVSLATLFADANLGSGDVLTLSIVNNTNAALVTPSLSGSTGQIHNSQLQLVIAADKSGTAVLTIRATDLAGESIDTTVVVDVGEVNDPPSAQVGNLSTNEDVALPIDLWALVTDVETPDANLTFTVASPSGGTAVLQADGHTVLFTPTGNYSDAAGFTYSVTDTGDGAAPAVTVGPVAVNITVNAVNDAPVAGTTTLTTTEDSAGVDVDLRTLVADIETGDDALIFSVSAPTHGTVSLLGDGHTARFIPAANYNGSATFKYTVKDTGDGPSGAITVGPTTINVTVNPVNDAPVAQVGNFATNEDTALSVDLWTLVEDVETADSNLVFTVASPGGGTAVLQADGHTVLFTPTGNYSGAGGFTYNVTDAGDGSSAAIAVGPTAVNITVNPVNDAPVAGTTTLVTDEDSAGVDVDLRTLVTDVETADDALIFTVAGASHGTVSLIAGHTARFVPAADFSGAGCFSYSVTDSGEGSSAAKSVGPTTINVTVNPVNDAPVAANDSYEVAVSGTLSKNASEGVLANDTDVDGNPLTAVLDATVQHGALTLNANGSFTYTPTTGFEGTDTFTYHASDGLLPSNVATVTIQVTANHAPDAVNDAYTTNEDTALPADASRNVLANDTDPDVGDTLTVSGFSATSSKGAAVTVNANGTFSYNPGTLFQYLAVGQQTTDTFTYTANDGHGGTDTAVVTITINGANDAPTAAGNVAATYENAFISINVVANDTDPDTADVLAVDTFDAVSEKGATITKNGDGTLKYDPTGSSTLRALTDGQQMVDTFQYTVSDGHGGTSTATVSVTVTGVAEVGAAVNVYLVVRDTATPTAEAQSTTLPASISTVTVGDNYVVEIWMQDTWTSSGGLTGGEFDVLFSAALSQGATLTDANHAGPFYMMPSLNGGTVNNTTGVVDDFETGTITAGIGVTPNFARLGYVTFTASAAGVQNFTFGTGTDGDGYPKARVARFGAGYVDTSQIILNGATVSQIGEMEPLTFTLADSCALVVGGRINGATLHTRIGKEPANTAAGLTGTLQVSLDDLDHPTVLQITGGTMDVMQNIPDGPFRPGIGGTDSSAYGDFELIGEVSVSELIELAIRDFIFSFSSDVLPVTSFSHFQGEDIQMALGSGFLDILSPAMGSNRYNMSGLVTNSVNIEAGEYGESESQPGTYELTFIYDRTIDIGGLSPLISDDSYLTVWGVVVAEYTPAGVMGTQTNESVDTGTGVAMTLSHEPTLVAPGGQVAALPTSEAWIDEWDSFWVEIWAKTDEATGVASARVDLQYNAQYFTATQIDHAGTFVQGATGALGQDGAVLGLGGSTSLTEIGGSGYALVARVKFESLGDNGVDINPDDLVLGPHDLGLRLDNVAVELVGQGAAEAIVWRTPETELWAVPYDVDDNGEIGLGDLSFFAASYGEDAIDADTAFGAALDFDHDGEVALGDLSYLAVNYGCARGGLGEVTFSESFTRQWIGAGLETDGDATVADLLQAAVGSWQEALGLPRPIEIQLVVRDFNSAQLAEAIILEVDATGIPTSGRVLLDDDANGLGWSARLEGEPAADQYDLYTVLLHEIGHALGFTSSYEGFADHIETSGDNSVFVAAGVSVGVDDAGNHLADAAMADDLMSSTLAPGVRKSISDLDVRMLHAAYQTASAGAHGHWGEGAALTAAAGPLAANVASTAEFGAIDGRLEGDVTWDRLVVGGSSKGDAAEDDALAVDAFDWLHAAPVATADVRRSARRETSEDEAQDEAIAELAAPWASRETEEDATDSLLADWQRWDV